jgi:putative flippase GtrA
LVHEFTKFGVIGAIALVVNVVVFNVLRTEIPSKVIVATVASTAVATLVAYFGNRYWTYKDRDSIGRHREMVLFFVVNGVAAVIEIICVAVSHYGMGFHTALDDNVAKYIAGVPLGMVFRLWTYRTFIFPKTAEAEAADGAVAAPATPHRPTSHRRTAERV